MYIIHAPTYMQDVTENGKEGNTETNKRRKTEKDENGKDGNKEKNKRRKKKKDENEDFIMRVGRIPMRSIQLNVCAYFYVN